MGYKERIFFAGVGTTFALLAIGFGGGLLLASSTLHDPAQRKAVPSRRLQLGSFIRPQRNRRYRLRQRHRLKCQHQPNNSLHRRLQPRSSHRQSKKTGGPNAPNSGRQRP